MFYAITFNFINVSIEDWVTVLFPASGKTLQTAEEQLATTHPEVEDSTNHQSMFQNGYSSC